MEPEVAERYDRLAPNFPEGECEASELAVALTRLVPEQVSTYVVGYRAISPRINYRHWGPAIRVTGWGFLTGGKVLDSNFAQAVHNNGLIISGTGACYRTVDISPFHKGERFPRANIPRDADHTRERMSSRWLIPSDLLELVRDRVVEWREADANLSPG